MEHAPPSRGKIFFSLFKANFLIHWRNRRSALTSMLVPILILAAWKAIVDTRGGPFVLSSCITIGLIAVGFLGFANSTARAREKGIFQRLRVTPADTFDIMASRIAVLLLHMAVMTVVLFAAAYSIDHLLLSIGGYIVGLLASLLCGTVFLALGLFVVGLISNAETVHSVSRLVYILLVVTGAVGELGVLGPLVQQIILWSPYGSVKLLLFSALQPSAWSVPTTIALSVSVAYCLVFIGLGIRWFKWSTN